MHRKKHLAIALAQWSNANWYRKITIETILLVGLITLSYILAISYFDRNSDSPLGLLPIGDKTVEEGNMLQFTVEAHSASKDVLVFSASNLPDGAYFDSDTQSFSWTPTYAQEGYYPEIQFEVKHEDEIAFENIAILVVQTNESTDVNQDGAIDISDVASVRERCGEEGVAGWIPEDINHDGIINVLDMIPIGQY